MPHLMDNIKLKERFYKARTIRCLLKSLNKSQAFINQPCIFLIDLTKNTIMNTTEMRKSRMQADARSSQLTSLLLSTLTYYYGSLPLFTLTKMGTLGISQIVHSKCTKFS